MRCFVDLGSANTGLVIGDMTYYARVLSDGSDADFSAATFTEPDSTNLPGLYILDAPSISEETRGRIWKTTTPAINSVVNFASGGDWTSDEREQIRYKLSIDGTQTSPSINGTSNTIDSQFTDISDDMLETTKSGMSAALGGFLELYDVDWDEDDALDIRVEGELTVGDKFKIAIYCAWTDGVAGRDWWEIENAEWFEMFQYEHADPPIVTALHPDWTTPGNRAPWGNKPQFVGFCWDTVGDPAPQVKVFVTPKTGAGAGQPMILKIPALEGGAISECPLFDSLGTARRKNRPFSTLHAFMDESTGADLPDMAFYTEVV